MFALDLLPHRTVAPTFFLIVALTFLSRCGTISATDKDEDIGLSTQPPPDQAFAAGDLLYKFCNINGTKLTPGECQWPCTNEPRCPEGTEHVSFEDCSPPAWAKALQAGSYNVTSDDDMEAATNGTNSTFSSSDVDSVDMACRSVCSEMFEVTQCCPGHYGSFCFSCPMSRGLVCSGHGVCDDGILGDGSCRCHANFTGMYCEKCENSNMYGVNCSEECLCVNGICDNSQTGSGICRRCFDGYHGFFCDEEIITCDELACPNNSECEEVYSRPQCVCLQGYEGTPDDVTGCTPINRCESGDMEGRKLCGKRKCFYTGPGTYECGCDDGYRNTGFECQAINPCLKDNGGCDQKTASCIHTGANASSCACLEHYEKYVPGAGCSLIDVCPYVSCNVNANCTTTGPDEHVCTCLPGYVGDGVRNCFGNIYDRLLDLNENDPFLHRQLSSINGLLGKFYKTSLREHGPFTIFVTNNRGFRKARRDFSYGDMIRQPSRTRRMIRQHILLGQLTLEDMQKFSHFYTLDGSIAELQVRVAKDVFKYKIRGHSSKAKVIARNYPASNGMIHVVNELLLNEPSIVGDTKKTALELIQTEGRFNRLQTLISSLGVEQYFERENITVFAPENGGLDNLPEGTFDYFMTEEEGKEKLKTLLENHIFSGKITVMDLVNTKRIHSIANYAFNVGITKMGRIQLGGVVNISQADIPCKNAVYYHIDGPLIPVELANILPSRCDIVKNTTVKGRCTACNEKMTCPLGSDEFHGEVTEGCRFWGELEGSFTQVVGCQPKCIRSYKIPKCCPGFYGTDCKPCPGGYKNPCGGRGKCSDERFGTGFCICDEHFRGDTCEKCLSRNKFGPNCTEACTCIHGRCDSGPTGTGKCVPGTCYAGFRGVNCHLERKRCREGRLLCHLHAECIEVTVDSYRCECQKGYEGNGQVCEEINPCEKPNRGDCHAQAKCTKIGPGSNQCLCDIGWVGDGFTCHPIIPCNNSDHCHSNAQCYNYQPGLFTCKCNDGYEGNGTYCAELDGCLINNGGCDKLANCTSTGPGTVNCTCPENYLGNGKRCFTTIAGHILSHENLTIVADLIRRQEPEDVILNDIGETFTFFAPSDDAMRQFMSKIPKDYLVDEGNIMSFFQFHTIDRDYTVQEMLALEGTGRLGRWETLFDGYSIRVFVKNKTVYVMSSQTTSSRVVAGDIPTLNGHLHIIDSVLEPFLPDAEQPFLKEFFQVNKPRFSVFGKWLEDKGLLTQLQAMDHYTLFVPDNDVFQPEQINHSITETYLKYYALPNVLLTPAIDPNQTAPTLLGSLHRLWFTTNGSQVFVNGVRIVDSNMLTVEGVVHTIDGLLRPVVNFCNQETFKTAFGLCGSCSARDKLQCGPGLKPSKSSFVQRYRCKYIIKDRSGMSHQYRGCRRLCEQQVLITECCAGYYGPNCTECPGGPETPCSGPDHGICDQGIRGLGQCLCTQLYALPTCDVCKGGNMAGEHCNISKSSCEYRNGNCSVNAQCSETGNGVHCRCRLGYVGDGYTCTSPCDTQNGGCHTNATCFLQDTDQAVKCVCKQGFHGNGVKCQANMDRCEVDGGGCSPYADCRYSPPPVTSEDEGNITCSCLPGYLGNGTLCVTTVLNALEQMASTSGLHKTLMSSVDSDNVTQLLGNDQASVTAFIPVGRSGTEVNLNDYMVLELVRLSEDLVADINNTDSGLYSASGILLPVTIINGQFYVSGARVVDRNIPATNGYINLLATPYGGLEAGKNTGSGNGSVMVIAVSVVVVLLLIVLVVIGVVCYHRSRASGFLDIVKRFRKGSDASMSFARLKAQESSEDDPHNPFNRPDNVNFDNPLYNDPDA